MEHQFPKEGAFFAGDKVQQVSSEGANEEEESSHWREGWDSSDAWTPRAGVGVEKMRHVLKPSQ